MLALLRDVARQGLSLGYGKPGGNKSLGSTRHLHQEAQIDSAKSGRTQFAGNFAYTNLSAGGKLTGWIFNGGCTSLAQPEHEEDSCQPERKPSQYNQLKPVHL